ncbi:protein hinderin isoform X2 [Vombatus ursinus]|uniref:protein hinderin isoform X2 n=1 Tax=Vombatus ursinus TaxID=29139 RepID=UPI000FFD333F|nr:protein hinderin isoform X2 [Vombatus ursinus]
MADVTAVTGSGVEAYWSRDLSDEEHAVLHISGTGRVKHKSKISKAGVKLKASKAADPSVAMDPFKGAGDSACKETVHNGGMKSACLKDLCPEDKRRIANLIKELARVSEEKEVTEERLKAEQESFEKKIRQLEEQNELIIREREALQQQYRECQELLSLYQKYLSEQQQKLSLSLSELHTGKVKEHHQVPLRKDSPRSPHQEQNGPCRNLTSSQNYQNKNEPKYANQSSASETNLHFRNYSPRMAALHLPQDGLNREQAGARTCNHRSPGAKLMGSIPTERASSDEMRLKEFSHSRPYLGGHCCVHSNPENEDHVHGNHQAKMTRWHPRTHHQEHCDYCELSWTPMLRAPVSLEPEEADDKKQMSAERRNQLLLQKMELEIEKERLQHLLAHQETKLQLKQQQLHQSRLDYSRLKSQAEFNSRDTTFDEALRKTQEPNLSLNGIDTGLRSWLCVQLWGSCIAEISTDRWLASPHLSLLKLKCDDYLLRTSSPNKGSTLHSEGHRTGKKTVGFRSAVDEDVLWTYQKNDMSRSRRGTMLGARKDATPSPIMSVNQKDFVTTATSPFQHDAVRYNTTLLDLVHSLSSSSAPRPRPPLLREAFAWNQRPVQVCPRKLTQASRACGPYEELEESRILEEIFFI